MVNEGNSMSDELRQEIERALTSRLVIDQAVGYVDGPRLADAVMAAVQPLVDERDRLKDEAVHHIAQRLALDEVAKHADALRVERDRLLWLHAEAVWQRDQLRVEADHQWTVRRQMGHRLIDLDSELTEAVDRTRWLHAESAWRLATSEDSRFRWAEEAAALQAKLDLPCGSCHPCTNWSDETWRRAGRKPPHVHEWDEAQAGLAALRASAVELPEDWRNQLGECESSGAAVDLVESWLGTVEAAPPHGPDAAPAVIPTFEMVAWCEIHDADARSCACPEGAYEERHWDCATAGGVCIERHVGVSGTGTEAASLVDVPEAEWQRFHEDALGARGGEAPDGAALIASKRHAVIAKGRTPAHDDQHVHGELLDAARCYANQGRTWFPEFTHRYATDAASMSDQGWPWWIGEAPQGWRPSGDPIENLANAGQLIAAEIDRLKRASRRQSEDYLELHEGGRASAHRLDRIRSVVVGTLMPYDESEGERVRDDAGVVWCVDASSVRPVPGDLS